MSTVTESFRLADMAATGFGRQPRHTATAVALPENNIGLLDAAAELAAPTIDWVLDLPGREQLVKLARALKRSDAIRTEAEEQYEERLNAITHGLGLAISMVAVSYLLVVVVMAGGWLRMASCGVYGMSLLLMYASSTGLHAVRRPKMKLRFQLFDHVSIYLLIAGTYTPFLALRMNNSAGFALLASVWALALAGIVIKVQNAHRLGDTSPLPCLCLGWLILIAIKPLAAAVGPGGMALLVIGGVCYSIGMLFYCRDDKRHFHAIWHLFVIAGTGMHFLAVVLYVAA
jgi:hemolysin III